MAAPAKNFICHNQEISLRWLSDQPLKCYIHLDCKRTGAGLLTSSFKISYVKSFLL